LISQNLNSDRSMYVRFGHTHYVWTHESNLFLYIHALTQQEASRECSELYTTASSDTFVLISKTIWVNLCRSFVNIPCTNGVLLIGHFIQNWGCYPANESLYKIEGVIQQKKVYIKLRGLSSKWKFIQNWEDYPANESLYKIEGIIQQMKVFSWIFMSQKYPNPRSRLNKTAGCVSADSSSVIFYEVRSRGGTKTIGGRRFVSSEMDPRIARWFDFKPKIPIWVKFGGSCYGKSLVYFRTIWSILLPLEIF
jgi:hypothetical protein